MPDIPKDAVKPQRPKRFYKDVAVRPEGEGFAVTLDGRPVRTPMKALLVMTTEVLAEAVAEEWRAQKDEIIPATMPLTQLANTALDRTPAFRAAIVDELVGYARHDLLCYHADGPDGLVAKQQAAWQPVLDWAAGHLDAPFAVTTGIFSVDQPETALKAVRLALETYDDLHLTVAQYIAGTCKSVLLGLAVVEGFLTSEAAHAASEVDETHQNELWGTDAEDLARRAGIRDELIAAGRFLALSRMR